MKLRMLFLLIAIESSFVALAQNENKPVQKKFEVEPASKSLLKLPEKNPLPDFLKKDFLSKTPNPSAAPKSFEQDIQMGLREQFLDEGEDYLKRLQSPEAEQNPGDFKVDQYLGDFKSSAERVRIVFRDHQQPDGDRIQVRLNDALFYPNILLVENYKKLDVDLILGFNKIDFVALNQGTSGPNTRK